MKQALAVARRVALSSARLYGYFVAFPSWPRVALAS